MFKTYLFPIAVALMIVPKYLNRAEAIPLASHDLAAVTPALNAEPVYYRGRGGVAVGPRGGVAVRGPRGGVAVRGPRGGVAVRGGAYRVGGRYYGGVWYGTGRRWYGGRWWPYGVGSCWSPSPIGYVWVCG
jgi:hypothetical protein